MVDPRLDGYASQRSTETPGDHPGTRDRDRLTRVEDGRPRRPDDGRRSSHKRYAGACMRTALICRSGAWPTHRGVATRLDSTDRRFIRLQWAHRLSSQSVQRGLPLPCPRVAFGCRTVAVRAVTIRQDRGELYKAAQRFVEVDALGSCVGCTQVLLSDSPCQVRACRVDSLTYRRRRRERGRHHRETSAREAEIEGWITNSRHRPVDHSAETTPLQQHVGGPQVTVDDRRFDGGWFVARSTKPGRPWCDGHRTLRGWR